MKIRVGNTEYPLEESWMTALRYRARYGASFLYADTSAPGAHGLALARLCYVGVIGDKPDETMFLREALADALFLRAAETFSARLYRPDASTDGIKGGPAIPGEQPDELHTAAAWAHCHLPERLLSELSVAQVAGLLHIFGQLAGTNAKPHPMDTEEMAGVYNISESAEQRIEAYLAGGAGH